MILTGTGHRPAKLGGWANFESTRLPLLIDAVTTELSLLSDKFSVDRVLTGMAMGYDYALGMAALQLKIPVVAVIPFNDFDSTWTYSYRRLYKQLLDLSAEYVVVTDDVNLDKKWEVNKALDTRNKYLVDNSDILLALFDGTAKGGTYNCLMYASKKQPKMIIHNMWRKWEKANAG